MLYKGNEPLICCLCSSSGVIVELPISLFRGRCKRGTAKQRFLFWKYLRFMPEPFSLLPPFLGHANSCIYCVTKTQMPLITLQSTSGLMVRICMCSRSRVWGLIAGHTTSSHMMRHGSKFLSLTCVERWEILTFLLLLFYGYMSVTGSGSVGRKDDVEWAVSLVQYKCTVPGGRHMGTAGAKLCQ